MASVTDLRAQSPSAARTIERSHHLTATKAYSLLNDTLPPESFLDGQPANILSRTEWLADNEAPTREIEAGSSPLLELGFGEWSLAVTLSGAASSQ
jgi:Flp pilus assembly protein TadD